MNRFAHTADDFADGNASARAATSPSPAWDSIDDEAFRRLAAATIWKAVEDARGDDGQVAYSAVRWLAGDTIAGLTLERCCQLLGISPEHVQGSLIKQFDEIRTQMERYRRVRLLSTRSATGRLV